MPLLILGAQTCPKEIEGTLYALLMSTLNVGGLVSSGLGGLLTILLGVTDKDFSNLWLLVVVCSLLNLLPMGFLDLVPTEKDFRSNLESSNASSEERRGLINENGDAAGSDY